MGIRQLNKLIRYHSPLETINLVELKNKVIVIDIMIYIYKFLANEALLENIYLLCVLLDKHNIEPIFIFDGHKPTEKNDELERRRNNRRKAWLKYDNMVEKLNEEQLKTEEAQKELSRLKRQCVKLKSYHIKDVQNLILYCGMKYIIAEGEADKLCAELVINKTAYACMSDDMDLFVYGCPIVLRLFNISKRNVVRYDLQKILSYLNMDIKDFRVMCTLCGTDYNISYNKYNIFNVYKKYIYYVKNVKNLTFLDWIMAEYNDSGKKCICDIVDMFTIDKFQEFTVCSSEFVNKIQLYQLLEKEFFLNPITVY